MVDGVEGTRVVKSLQRVGTDIYLRERAALRCYFGDFVVTSVRRSERA